MTNASKIERRRWQPMLLKRVGDLSSVMQVKSGPHCDPSPVHVNKRGFGPPPGHC